MLFLCPKIETFWNSIRVWLGEIGYKGYIISIERIILGDVENSDIFSYIILVCKKIILGRWKKENNHIYNNFTENWNSLIIQKNIYLP